MIRLALDALLEFNAPLGVLYRRFLQDSWVSSQLDSTAIDTVPSALSIDNGPLSASSSEIANPVQSKTSLTKSSKNESIATPPTSSSPAPSCHDVESSDPNPGLFTVATAIYGSSVFSETVGKEIVSDQRRIVLEQYLQENKKAADDPSAQNPGDNEDDSLSPEELQARKSILWNVQHDVAAEKSTIQQQIIAEYILARLYCDDTLIGTSRVSEKNAANSKSDQLELNPFFSHFIRLYVQVPQLRYLLFRILNGKADAAELSSLPISFVLNQCVKVAYDLRGNQLYNPAAQDPLNPLAPASLSANGGRNNRNGKGPKGRGNSSSSSDGHGIPTSNGSYANAAANGGNPAASSSGSSNAGGLTKTPIESGPERGFGAGWIAGRKISWIKKVLLNQGLDMEEIYQILTPTDPIDILDRLEDVVSAPVYTSSVELERFKMQAHLSLTMFYEVENVEKFYTVDGETNEDSRVIPDGLCGKVSTVYARNMLPLVGVDPTTMESASLFKFPGHLQQAEAEEASESGDDESGDVKKPGTRSNRGSVGSSGEREFTSTASTDSNGGGTIAVEEEPAPPLTSSALVANRLKSVGLTEREIQKKVVTMYRDRFQSLIKSQSSIESASSRAGSNSFDEHSEGEEEENKEKDQDEDKTKNKNKGKGKSVGSPPMMTNSGVVTELKKNVLLALLNYMAGWYYGENHILKEEKEEEEEEEISDVESTHKQVRKSLLESLCVSLDPHVTNDAVDFLFKLCIGEYSSEGSSSLTSELETLRKDSKGNGGKHYILDRGEEFREMIYGVILRWLEGASSSSSSSSSGALAGGANGNDEELESRGPNGQARGEDGGFEESSRDQIRLICLVIKSLDQRGFLEPKSEYNLLFGLFVGHIGKVEEAREVYFMGRES